MISKPQHYLKNGCDRWKIDFSFTLNEEYIRFRCAGFITEKEAVEWLEKQYHGIKYGFIQPPEKGDRPGRKRKHKDTVTVAQVFAIIEPFWQENLRVNTVRQWISTAKKYILPRIGNRLFSQLGNRDLQKIYDGATEATQTTLTKIIKNLMNNAKACGLIPPSIESDQFSRYASNKRETYLTPDELSIVLNNASPKVAPVITMLVYSGIRIGEALALEWRDIDLKGRTILINKSRNENGSIGPTKTGKTRTIPLHPMVHNALKMIAQQSGGTWKTSGYVVNVTRATIMKETKLLGKMVGKPELVIHSYRHTCASLLINAGESLEKIGYILGQSSAQVTAQYAHLCTASMHNTIAILPSISYEK